MTARKVGRLHSHVLPDPKNFALDDVVRCVCNKEFFLGQTQAYGETGWFSLGDTPHYVEYEDRSSGEPEIGIWTPPVSEAEAQPEAPAPDAQ